MSSELPCTLIYARDGFAWIRYGGLDEPDDPRSCDLSCVGNLKSRFNTLYAAYAAAASAGHRPTHWASPETGVRLKLDHAEHWLRQLGLESTP